MSNVKCLKCVLDLKFNVKLILYLMFKNMMNGSCVLYLAVQCLRLIMFYVWKHDSTMVIGEPIWASFILNWVESKADSIAFIYNVWCSYDIQCWQALDI